MKPLKPLPLYERGLVSLAQVPGGLKDLEVALNLLAAGKTLPEKFLDHALRSPLLGYRSCVAGRIPLDPDDPLGDEITFLLIYRITAKRVELFALDQHDDIYKDAHAAKRD